MNTKSLCAALFLFALCFSCADPASTNAQDSSGGDSVSVAQEKAANMGLGGTYSFGTNAEEGAVGAITVYPESDSTFLFYLDFNKGAPSFNMGIVSGRARLRNETWKYMNNGLDAIEACEIEFMFSEKFVQIVTRENGCGFGANVLVDHVYDRTSSTVPEFFTGPEGDTVYFSNLAKAVR